MASLNLDRCLNIPDDYEGAEPAIDPSFHHLRSDDPVVIIL
jgi:hypothetical protein